MRCPPLAALALTSALVLEGCAVRGEPPRSADDEIDRQIVEAAQRIQTAQALLYQSGVMSRTPPQYGGPGTEQLVTLNWHGDALQLLAKLAHDFGISFVFTGVRLPLPVTVAVQNATINDVLAQVRAQIGYRATIQEEGETLTLRYNPPRS